MRFISSELLTQAPLPSGQWVHSHQQSNFPSWRESKKKIPSTKYMLKKNHDTGVTSRLPREPDAEPTLDDWPS